MDQNISWYVFEINPEPWRIGPASVGRKADKLFPIIGRDQQLAAFQEAIREELEADGYDKLVGDVTVTFFFWRRRDVYNTPQARSHRKHEADVTNLQKATEDALQGYLYDNDKDNVHVESHMVEQGPEVRGKIVVRVANRSAFNPDLIPASVWEVVNELEQEPEDVGNIDWFSDNSNF